MLIVGFCMLLPATAKASVAYLRVLDDGVALYTNAETKKITCLLEKSYYLAVLDDVDNFYKVEIMGKDASFPKIVGFVDKNSVAICDSVPVDPMYPTVSITVSQSSAQIRFSPLESAEILLVATNTQQMSYYGSYVDSNQTLWYYVYFNGYFGYVKSIDVTKPQIQLHPTPLPQPILPSEPPKEPTEQIQPNTPTTVDGTNEVLLIAFAGILATALTCALFLPKQSDKSKSFYTENR